MYEVRACKLRERPASATQKFSEYPRRFPRARYHTTSDYGNSESFLPWLRSRRPRTSTCLISFPPSLLFPIMFTISVLVTHLNLISIRHSVSTAFGCCQIFRFSINKLPSVTRFHVHREGAVPRRRYKLRGSPNSTGRDLVNLGAMRDRSCAYCSVSAELMDAVRDVVAG
ncbi:hypothetical protein EVAR_75000_1 [Eumeta japonica]|uniref:Uncharacterized protein n=1 Tax=Eumeta variegata TaxID=151549 RepID=A0A4C1VDH8_EUMVA|nr:hypothetical protein EVAR_75000_1 [Eumeta japonica]